ncbi:DUF2784 domain-containing protein [Crenobacter cavernae]|uniref:DUF2784 domain-containing protein n=1 Tax=Crenobacter cavernae TaxID=2290923 RepID=A0ABY0FCW6_9NEIS|nr:DUF2784 domain-containing protein [Crenobacter cavernae]RXZ43997.1 DUF2784 domain-containing protein [Crenobacter cavernae]
MPARLAADAVVFVHLAFIVFVMFGGLLALRWPRVAWLHLPAFAWGVTVETMHWVCPLTPLENALRRAAGEAGYDGGFVEHYLLPLIYPAGLTADIQAMIGLIVIATNAAVYGFVAWRRTKNKEGG